MNAHDRIVHALTHYDIRASERPGYNPNALSLYLDALEQAETEAARLVGNATTNLAEALERRFAYNVLTVVLTALRSKK